MKKFVIYIVIATITCIIWAANGEWYYDREVYVSNKVLDNSIPFDVKIDEEFLNSLLPANESSGSSSKGL